MTATAAITRSWSVGQRTVTLTVPAVIPRGGALNVLMEWDDLPDHLTDAEMAEYRAGRDRAIREIAEQLGVRAAVWEL